MRFGLSACNALVPSAGMRVDVLSAEKRGNVLRATSVQPILEQVDIEQVVWPEALQAFAAGVVEEIGLAAEPALSIPPAWTFKPRCDVEGHVPVGGVAAELLDVSILRDRAAQLRYAYEEAYFAYDRHYASLQADVTVGGFSTHPFALCRTCQRPLRQLLRIHDYFCSPPLADVFEGSNDFTLLSCERTPACGGPTRGLLVIGP